MARGARTLIYSFTRASRQSCFVTIEPFPFDMLRELVDFHLLRFLYIYMHAFVSTGRMSSTCATTRTPFLSTSILILCYVETKTD